MLIITVSFTKMIGQLEQYREGTVRMLGNFHSGKLLQLHLFDTLSMGRHAGKIFLNKIHEWK